MTGIVVIVLDQVYDVRHGQHAGKLGPFAIPQGSGYHICNGVDGLERNRISSQTIEQRALKGLFHVQLGVENDKPAADWECVVECAALEDVVNRVQSDVMRSL